MLFCLLLKMRNISKKPKATTHYKNISNEFMQAVKLRKEEFEEKVMELN